jgi:hypothetical protein
MEVAFNALAGYAHLVCSEGFFEVAGGAVQPKCIVCTQGCLGLKSPFVRNEGVGGWNGGGPSTPRRFLADDLIFLQLLVALGRSTTLYHRPQPNTGAVCCAFPLTPTARPSTKR